MSVLGIDLGGTKLAYAAFTEEGRIILKETVAIEKRQGSDVGRLITGIVMKLLERFDNEDDKILSIGISVPGISNSRTGKVWAPNIPGWTEYPLLDEVKEIAGDKRISIDSDRTCYILGEIWQGNAAGCRDAIFLSIGTGIGAGIVTNGEVLHGSNDIAGATGWMALARPFKDQYRECGCFEYHASGEGIAKVIRKMLEDDKDYSGELRNKEISTLTSYDVFKAFNNGDPLATEVVNQAVEFWGMAVANFVSIFNPEKIIFGGGVFGPAKSLLPSIRKEAARWAQPVSITQVELDVSGLEGDAGVYGAGYLALQNLRKY